MECNTFDALVIGSGAAGYSAACELKRLGAETALLTEGVNCGASRNTGSDKQTYYKLNLGGGEPDGVRLMAEELFACGAVDGDNALCEAAYSAECFLRLAALGVPFPRDAYGVYAGYKTDHDSRARASSAGPLTSKYMTEALEREAKSLGVPIFDRCYVYEILTDGAGVCGALALDPVSGERRAFGARAVVLATGGPAGIYADSVYPASQFGSTGLALRAGAAAQNLTCWQYGLAAVSPRWNVSGTFMQALPRLVSVDGAGVWREFLTDYIPDPADALDMVFLKGYQWPFDERRSESGSSRVDLAVYAERAEKGRRVFLDYTKNPFGFAEIAVAPLGEEAHGYLAAADALFGTPIGRLRHMNEPAYRFFASRGAVLERVPLEIALCAQHCNGGVAVDADWQTAVPGLFAAGECAGTHGLRRPGGSALNAGQVGALRAARKIARTAPSQLSDAAFEAAVARAAGGPVSFPDASERTAALQKEFSVIAGAVKKPARWEAALKTRAEALRAMRGGAPADLAGCRLRETLLVQSAMLTALIHARDHGGFSAANAQEIRLTGAGEWAVAFRPVRPIPETDPCFENVWRAYRASAPNRYEHA